MVIGIIGGSCTGKSTLADKLGAELGAQVYTGKDYLRLAKSESMARNLFKKKLQEKGKTQHMIYVISEKEHLSLLPEDALRILVTADLEEIKRRFAARMKGTLPPPVAAMLEKKHGCFDAQPHDLHVVSGCSDLDVVCAKIRSKLR